MREIRTVLPKESRGWLDWPEERIRGIRERAMELELERSRSAEMEQAGSMGGGAEGIQMQGMES